MAGLCMAAACMLVSDFSYSLINIIYTPGSCRRWHLPSWATLAELSDGRPAAKALKYIFLHSNAGAFHSISFVTDSTVAEV